MCCFDLGFARPLRLEAGAAHAVCADGAAMPRQGKEAYARELEELVPQCEALMADKAALEEQLAGRGSSEQELSSQLLLLNQDRAALEAALQAARRDAQQVLPLISVLLQEIFTALS